MGHLVFVYGTLKRGERNHHRMAGARFVGDAVTRDGAFTLTEQASVSTPGRTTPSVRTGGAHRIAGELYEVDNPLLAALDRFERVGTDYDRVPIPFASGQVAEIYLSANGSRPSRREAIFARCSDGVASWSERAS